MNSSNRIRRPSSAPVQREKKQKKKRHRKPLVLRILGSIGSVILTTFLSFFLLFAVTGTICAIAATIYITNYMETRTN